MIYPNYLKKDDTIGICALSAGVGDDIEEYEKIRATLKLMNELEKGERSARENGWIDFSEIEKEFANDIKD